MAVNGVSTDRNYLETIGNKDNTDKPGKVYNAVFSNGDEDNLSINDFFDMMILQLTNQDFMNPVDDTQYLSQMAQFATMQEMMDLAQFSKQNYVMSILGKEVTVGKHQIGGKTTDITGVVEKIMIQDGEYKIYVDGKPYDLNKITQITSDSKKADDKTDDTDNTVEVGDLDDIGKTDETEKPTESGEDENAGAENAADNTTEADG